MSFSDKELELIQQAKAQGKTKEQALAMLAGSREVQPAPQRSSIVDFGIGAAKGLGDTLYGTANLITEGGRYLQAAVHPTKTVKDLQQEAEQAANTGPWWVSPFAGKTQENVESALEAKNPAQMTGKAAEFAAELLTPAGWWKSLGKADKASDILRGVEEAVDTTLDLSKGKAVVKPDVVSPTTLDLSKSVVDTAPEISKTGTMQGAKQTAQEIAERVPRFVGRVQSGLEESAVKADKIKNATPAVAEAYKVDLPERFINTVQQADPATVKAYKEIVKIADNPNEVIKASARPEIVAGNAASEQYKLIDKTRKSIGEQIGGVVDGLSKKGSVDVLPAQRQMRDVLRQNGVMPDTSGVLKFTGKFTPAERAKIQQLYELATEGGEKLSPRQVYDMDRLFSKLQREARFENVGDIMVSTQNGDMSLFRVFRDIYSNQLDDIAPEIRNLNRQYRNIVTLQDDIENSIIKSGNFDTSRGVDAAEFAQTNLRRLFSEAQSAADYRQIYEEMDNVSRALGYDGARADDLAAFAYELRKLYPETTPRTGLEGSIGTSIKDFLSKATSAGAPNVEDQRKALNAILDEAISNNQ